MWVNGHSGAGGVRIIKIIIQFCVIILWGNYLFGQNTLDLFEEAKGINATVKYNADNIDTNTTREFLPFQRGFTRQGDEWVFGVPQEDPPATYRYMGIGPIPVKELHRYTLDTEEIHYKTNGVILYCLSFFNGDAKVLFATQERSRTHDFGVPPGVNNAVVWIGVTSPNKVEPGPQVGFKALKLIDRGLLDGTDDIRPLLGRNLLSVSNFEECVIGPYTNNADFRPGSGADRNFAEIVKEETQCLHISKSTNGYKYPYFNTQKLDLNNCAVVFTCRLKGKGKVSPMIWWHYPTKKNFWSHYAGQAVELGDTWQTVSLWHYCTVSNMDHAAVSIAVGSPQAEIYVDDMSLKIIDPRSK